MLVWVFFPKSFAACEVLPRTDYFVLGLVVLTVYEKSLADLHRRSV